MSDVQNDLFSGVKLGHIDDPMEDYAEYTPVYLNEQIDKAVYIGKPLMLEPFSYNYEDDKTGKEITKNKFRLCLMRHDDEEYLEISVNLKKEGDAQKNVRKGSVLFDLLYGLMEHTNPGSMKGSNVFEEVNLSSIRDFVNGLELMKVEVVEVRGRFKFNTIKVGGVQ